MANEYNDIIHKKDVYNILEQHWLNGTVAKRIVDEIKSSIESIPPADDVKPIVKSEWIEYTEKLDYGTRSYYICKHCGENCCCNGNFCPECGAIMRKEE